MNDNLNRGIDPNEMVLNSLFKEVLDGLRDDLTEAQINVDMYHEAIQPDGGKDLYGAQYMDALKVKGMVRDRQLKFLQGFKERVTTKEANLIKKEIKQMENPTNSGAGFNHADMNKILEDMSSSGKLENIQLEDFGNDDDDDE